MSHSSIIISSLLAIYYSLSLLVSSNSSYILSHRTNIPSHFTFSSLSLIYSHYTTDLYLFTHLGLKVGIWRGTPDLHGGNIKMHEDVLEGGAVSGFAVPTHLHNEAETVWTSGRDREVEGVGTHTIDDC